MFSALVGAGHQYRLRVIADAAPALPLGIALESIQIFSILVLAFELGFPLILLIKSVKLRLGFILGVTSFHIATFVLMDVNFLLIPFVYLIFFDLVPIHAWLKPRVDKILGRRHTTGYNSFSTYRNNNSPTISGNPNYHHWHNTNIWNTNNSNRDNTDHC
jgi:hypothetical protein